ncbi:ABC transporter substrate-binding protein [Neobacillus bataviensis]|uniref:ABC transporter substrate-binding protein n=1 Tax=Neobacillus bataviensis TaxID=220685 RepID=UPI001CBB12BD|nr:ABC transporter substrate-binding protein [Neobacillus bataviensis]
MRKKVKWFLSTVITVVLISTILIGCSKDTASSGNGSGKQVNIKFWTQSDPTYKKAAQTLIDKFEKENPNIKVKLESFPEYATKVSTAFNTGNAPDVLEMFGSSIKLAQGGKVLPVPESVMSKAEIEKTFTPDSLKNRTYKGKYYGLPNEISMESPGLLINEDLVKKAGLTIPESWVKNNGPASWAELRDFAEKLTVIENGVMKQAGLGVIGGQEEAMFLSLIWQYGGEYRDEKNGKVNFTSPEAKKAIEFIQGLISGDHRVHDKGFSKRFDGFVGKSNAMTIGAPWYAASISSDVKDFKYQYFNLPPFVDGSKPYFVTEGGWGYLVSAKSKHPEESWKLVKFLLQKDNQDYWTKEVGSISSRTDAAVNTNYDPAVGSVEKAIAISSKITNDGRDAGAYTGDTSQLIWTIVRQNLAAILQKEVSIDKGLKNMEDQANQMIERNNRK